MGFALGHKIDVRLKAIEARLDALLEEICTTDEGLDVLAKRLASLDERIKELEAKRGPGRPKATDGK